MQHETEQLQLIIENTRGFAMVLLDTERRITLWNSGAERLLGWQEAEIIGQSADTFFTSEDRAAGVPERETRCAREQERAEEEHWYVRKDGSRFWGSGLVQTVNGDGDALRGYLKIFRDLTDRHKAQEDLRESEARFRALAENIAQLAWMADGTGWIFWYNRRWFDYTGTTLEEMQGWGWKSVHHPDYLTPVTQRWSEHLRAGREWEDTFPLRRKDGHWGWFLSRAFPIRDEAGNVTHWFGTNTDITEQKQAEEALRRNQAEMEALNVRLARAMQETHHRVKNNLQVISALMEIEEINTGGGAHFWRIKQHTQALAMIHDILTAQTKGNALDTSHVSTQTVLGRLVSMLDQSSGTWRIRADVDEMMLPVQKSASLALLVNECVSNAMKHGANDIEITLRLSEPEPLGQEPRADRQARLEVCDNGPGFPPGFDPRKAANTGLELIESAVRWDLRGDVQYENRTEGGARVVVTFPVRDVSVEQL